MASDRRPTDPVRTDDSSDMAMAVLARETRSASVARSWLRGFLDEAGMPEPVQADAALVISELVTNALRHGLGEIVARATIGGDGHVDVAVTDSGAEQPVLQAVDPERVGGVGLHVVAQVSDEWGVAQFPGGKTVWARIAIPGR
jgi:anti-sigma regulatory factor (Ser/Thr protein kinase)